MQKVLAEVAAIENQRPRLAQRSRPTKADTATPPISEDQRLPHVARPGWHCEAAVIEASPADLGDRAGLCAILDAAPLVLNAAGPYALTGRPILGAALATSTAYLDLNGELPFSRELLGMDDAAKKAGIPLFGGVGFGVVAEECLGRHVVDRLPGIQESFDTMLAILKETLKHSLGR